ncbi:MAG: hypothetical protein KAS23_12055 [Anaerohalosphaera sp.]|nr:hypothetical protein [Anaerohalosphaera sp.]
MKFIALLKNELKTAFPWILLALIIFLFVALPALYLESDSRWDSFERKTSQKDYSGFGNYSLGRSTSMTIFGPGLLIASLAMGVILALRHFYVPFFTKTWQFTLHRSVSRLTVLSAKLTAATIAFIIALFIPWLTIYSISCLGRLFPVPPSMTTFVEGILFILTGLVAYLAVAASAISTARWYTTKMFPIAFAALGICSIFEMSSIALAFVLIVIISAIMKIQLIHNFQTRQF